LRFGRYGSRFLSFHRLVVPFRLKTARPVAEFRAVSVYLDKSELRELRRKAQAATLAALQALGGEARREAIIARALADGGFKPRELAAAAPEAARTQYTRLVEYKLSFALTDLKYVGLFENPEKAVWRLAGAALETPLVATADQVDEQRLVELRAMTYNDYLRTPEWRRTRAAALLRAGYCCSLDITHSDGLDVHHNTYERLGAELAGDLVVLCRSCHRLHHGENGRPRRGQPTRRPIRVTTTKTRKRSLLRRLLAG
jgi:5-methylcytosine-specific restriction endonuclease McrA